MQLPSSPRFFQVTFFILLLGVCLYMGSAFWHMPQDKDTVSPSPALIREVYERIHPYSNYIYTPEQEMQKQKRNEPPIYWIPTPPPGSASIQIQDIPTFTYESPNTASDINIAGSAAYLIDEIRIKTNCREDGLYEWVSIQRPLEETIAPQQWQWSHTLSEKDRTLCAGKNWISFVPVSAGHEYSTYTIRTDFYSLVGYIDPDLQKKINILSALPEYAPEYAPDDKTIEHILYHPILKNEELCSWERSDQPLFADILVDTIELDDLLGIRLRSWNPTDFPGIKNSDYSTPILEFVKNNQQASSSSQDIIPSPLAALPCPYTTLAGAKIYYVHPDRILVDLGYGYETPRYLYVWDGKEWRSAYSIALTHNPLSLGSVNKKGFELFETGGCCEQAYPTVPGKWSAMYVDFETLEVEGVLFSERPAG